MIAFLGFLFGVVFSPAILKFIDTPIYDSGSAVIIDRFLVDTKVRDDGLFDINLYNQKYKTSFVCSSAPNDETLEIVLDIEQKTSIVGNKYTFVKPDKDSCQFLLASLYLDIQIEEMKKSIKPLQEKINKEQEKKSYKELLEKSI